MKLSFDFSIQLPDTHSFTIGLEDGRVLEVWDNGCVKVFENDEYKGEFLADMAQVME